MRSSLCLGSMLCLLSGFVASAAVHEGKGWRIEKWAEETTVEGGGTIHYRIRVTRVGTGTVSAVIQDYQNSGDQTTGYSNVTPAEDAGDASFVSWNRTLGEGQSFEASYDVSVNPTSPVGRRIANFLYVADTADVSQKLSLDHYLFVGGGNKTKAGNRCADGTKDPVATATGEYYLPPVTDLDLGGPLPLTFTRWYASQINDPGIDLIDSALGRGWMHAFEAKGSVTGQWERVLRVVMPGGKIVTFAETYLGTTLGWQINHKQEGVQYQFRDDKQNWWLMDPQDERLYRFDRLGLAAQGVIRLQEILDRNGNSLLLKRRADGLVTNITDGLGRRLDFSYTAASNLLSVTDGSRTVSFGYDATRTLAAVTDAVGQATFYRYDPANSFSNLNGALMTEIQYPRGNVPYTQTYNTNGQVALQTDAYGAMSTFAYGTNGVAEVTDPQGSFTHGYANYRRATNLADQAGNSYRLDYGEAYDLWTSFYDRRGFLTLQKYDEESRKPDRIVHRDGGTTTYQYAWTDQVFTNSGTGTNTVTFSFHDLQSITHPDGTTEHFQRDGRGNVTSYVDRAGAGWATTYNAHGQPLTLTRPGGGVRTFAYNADGTVATETDGDTGITTNTYDALRRRTGTEYPDGSSQSWAYDGMDRVTNRAYGYGYRTDYSYDANGILARITDPTGYAVTNRADLMDRTTNHADGTGFLWSRAYDNMGRVVVEADPAGTNHYAYDARGWPTNASRGARSQAWSYDAEGNVTRAVSPLGHATTWGYDPMGRVTAVTNPLGYTAAFEYDTVGRVTAARDPLGNTTRYGYDGEGRITAVTNAAGAVASFSYDTDGRLVRRSDFDGNTTTYGYTPMGKLSAITNPLGDVTRFSYDTMGRLARTDYADGRHAAVGYDAVGRVRSYTNAAGFNWDYGWSARDELTVVTNPSGGVTACTYNPDGTERTRTDSDIGINTNYYDAARRLVRTDLPGGSSYGMEYNEHHELTAVVDARGGRTEYVRDADGRLTAVMDQSGRTNSFGWDPNARMTNWMDRAGGRITYEYDAAGRLVARVDLTGVRAVFRRDVLGRSTNVTVGTSTWTVAYNLSGVVTQMVSPSGRATAFVPDALQRVRQIVNAAGETNTITYDARGRVERVTDPAGRSTQYEYDPRGLLSRVTLPDTTSVAYVRDALGNVSRLTDAESNSWEFAYSSMGRLRSVTDPLSRVTTYTNDARGQVSGMAYPNGQNVAFTRDADGNVVRALYSDGPDLPFGFDPVGRVTNAGDVALVRDGEGRIVATQVDGPVFSAARDTAGRLTAATYNNGAMVVNYTYDIGPTGDGKLTRVSDNLTGTQVDFGYDADRRLRTVTLPNGETILYTWDDADRLARLQSGNHVDIQLTYDQSGRITESDQAAPLDPGPPLGAGTNDWAFDAASQVSSPGYAYDPRGRLTNAPGNVYVWDGASRLVGIGGVALSYDGFDNLRLRADGPATNRFFHNHSIAGAPIVAERNEVTGQMLRYYVWTPSGRLLYMVDAVAGNKVYFYHFDQVGNTLALTDTNAAVTDAWAYDPYGRILARTGTNPQPFTFSGAWGVRQEGTNGALYHMRARYYDAASARFLSPEPVWPQLENPKAINPYQYAGTDPIRYADPSGLFFDLSWDEMMQGIGQAMALGLMAPYVEAYEEGGESGLFGLMKERGLWDRIQQGQDPGAALDQFLKAVQQAQVVLRAREKGRCHQQPKNDAPRNGELPAPLYEVLGPPARPPAPLNEKRLADWEWHVARHLQRSAELLDKGYIVEGPPPAPPAALPPEKLAAWDALVAEHLKRSAESLARGYEAPAGSLVAGRDESRQAIRAARIEEVQQRWLQLQRELNELQGLREALPRAMKDMMKWQSSRTPDALLDLQQGVVKAQLRINQVQREMDELRTYAQQHDVSLMLVE